MTPLMTTSDDVFMRPTLSTARHFAESAMAFMWRPRVAVGIAILVAAIAMYDIFQWTSHADSRTALQRNHATCVAQLRTFTPTTAQTATEVARVLEICAP